MSGVEDFSINAAQAPETGRKPVRREGSTLRQSTATVRSTWRSGRGLALPVLLAAAVTASAGGLTTVTVHHGDTLSAIAARHGTSVSQLVAVNHLPGNGDLILAGTTVKVPTGSEPSGAAPATHTVRPGDNLIGLAARFGTSPQAIATLNGLANRGHIEIGQRLRIPGKSHPTATPTTQAAQPGLSHAAVHDLIVRSAERFGVDPALALGVAWQESGFQQDLRSRSGAIGIMQVMPSSGRFVSRWIVGHPLNLHQPQDNVTAGVALLAALLHQAPLKQAVAGYYQGLASVRAHGVGPGTRHYVDNVLALRNRFG
jgi:LysM repeat protein